MTRVRRCLHTLRRNLWPNRHVWVWGQWIEGSYRRCTCGYEERPNE